MGEFLRLCYILCLWSEKKQRIYFPRVLRKQIQSTESQSLTAQAGSVSRTPKNKGLSFSPHQAMPLYPSSRSIIAVSQWKRSLWTQHRWSCRGTDGLFSKSAAKTNSVDWISITAQAGSVSRTPKNKGLSFSPHQAMPLYPSSRSIIAVQVVLVNSTSMILPRHGCTCRFFSAVSPAKWLPQQFTQPSAWIAALKLHNGRKPGSRFKREQLTIVI